MNLPIFLFTDFGAADLYVGQVKAVLHAQAQGSTVIDLLNDAPRFDIAAGAHLLAALAQRLPTPSAIIAVVDPGVGSARGAVVLEADGRWFVGPDNGLLSVVAAHARATACFTLDWLPAPRSASFHGRDLFAPAAAEIASGRVDMSARPRKSSLDVRLDAAELPRIIYIDHYGNAITDIRAAALDPDATVKVRGRRVHHARVFSDVPHGELFWYGNSIDLVEIAANQASACALLNLHVGEEIAIVRP